jgi:hypothetical protein
MDPNDPAFPYLSFDKKSVTKDTGNFDSRKSTWIPDDKEGFIKADIVNTAGEKVTVRTDKGEVS